MSEFGKLEGDVEQEAKDHPQQVHEAEQDAERAAESKLGIGGDENQGSQQNQDGQQDQTAQQGQDSQQDGDDENSSQQGQDR